MIRLTTLQIRIGPSAFIALLIALAGSANVVAAEKRPWTLLVYGAADNNADGPILEFLAKVCKAIDDDPGLDVLLFIDRSVGFSNDAKYLGEDFAGCRLFRLRRNSVERLSGGSQFPEITREKDAELDSADASTLGRFIAWGKATSPAEHYGLLIYSHANGQTMCPDQQSGHEMGIAEVTDKIGPEGHVDFLALELCEMGGIEIGYQWRPGTGHFGADVLLAIPNAGPPLSWERAFARIRSTGHDSPADRPPLSPATMSAADFGKLVIEEGLQGRLATSHGAEAVSHESAGCYDLSQAAEVKMRVNALARTLLDQPGSRGRMLDSRNQAMNYSDRGPYVDLFDLCRRAAADENLSPKIRAAAREAGEAVDRFVVASFGMSAYNGFEPGRNGVFIVFPASGTWKRCAWYTPDAGTEGAYGRWDFLRGEKAAGGDTGEWYTLLRTWLADGEAP